MKWKLICLMCQVFPFWIWLECDVCWGRVVYQVYIYIHTYLMGQITPLFGCTFPLSTCVHVRPSTERIRYEQYRTALRSQGLRVVPVEGDGNCLFRSVSHQIYGDDSHHRLVRARCMDYMEVREAWIAFSREAQRSATKISPFWTLAGLPSQTRSRLESSHGKGCSFCAKKRYAL